MWSSASRHVQQELPRQRTVSAAKGTGTQTGCLPAGVHEHNTSAHQRMGSAYSCGTQTGYLPASVHDTDITPRQRTVSERSPGRQAVSS